MSLMPDLGVAEGMEFEAYNDAVERLAAIFPNVRLAAHWVELAIRHANLNVYATCREHWYRGSELPKKLLSRHEGMQHVPILAISDDYFWDWTDNVLRIEYYPADMPDVVAYFLNPHLDRADIDWWLGSPSPGNLISPPWRKKTGRKPHPSSDVLWAEMARRAFSGEFIRPSGAIVSQAEAVRALADWLIEQGEEMAEATIREKVALLWTRLGWR